MQTLHLHRSERALPEHTTMLQMFRHIYKNEGILAFYQVRCVLPTTALVSYQHATHNFSSGMLDQGLSASFLGLAHVAVQFPLYEQLKYLARQRNHGNPESALDVLMASAVSKLVAMITTYPHEVIRARLQDQHRNPGQNMNLVGMFRCVRQTDDNNRVFVARMRSLTRFPVCGAQAHRPKRRMDCLVQRTRCKYHPGLALDVHDLPFVRAAVPVLPAVAK